MASSASISTPLLDGLLKPGNGTRTWTPSIEVSAVANTEGFWDREFQIKAKVNELKQKFHKNRYLRVKHLPSDVSKEEVKQMLSDFPVEKIQFTNQAGSAGQASVYLEDPEMLEDWDNNRKFMLRGQRIPVAPSYNDLFLCITRLPLNFTSAQLTNLVKVYGDIRLCFMMISERTGNSKGYGFVQYKIKENGILAKNKMHGQKLRDLLKACGGISNGTAAEMSSPEEDDDKLYIDALEDIDVPLWADFIEPSEITFEALHSKCIVVSNLPSGYRNMQDLRKRFSCFARPPYCQIAINNGCLLDWGLIEYNNARDAEMTSNALQGSYIRGSRIRVDFYVPGIRAVHIYRRLTAEPVANNVRNNGNGLLPDPPGPAIYETVTNLFKRNPLFALNVESIIVSERQGAKLPSPDGFRKPEQLENIIAATRAKLTPSPKSQLSPVPSEIRDIKFQSRPSSQESFGSAQGVTKVLPVLSPGIPEAMQNLPGNRLQQPMIRAHPPFPHPFFMDQNRIPASHSPNGFPPVAILDPHAIPFMAAVPPPPGLPMPSLAPLQALPPVHLMPPMPQMHPMQQWIPVNTAQPPPQFHLNLIQNAPSTVFVGPQHHQHLHQHQNHLHQNHLHQNHLHQNQTLLLQQQLQLYQDKLKENAMVKLLEEAEQINKQAEANGKGPRQHLEPDSASVHESPAKSNGQKMSYAEVVGSKPKEMHNLRALWNSPPRLPSSATYMRMGPDGKVEEVRNPLVGLWTPNTSPPSLGSKRRHSILPSLEETPEGAYFGQIQEHGGLYSYSKRQKM